MSRFSDGELVRQSANLLVNKISHDIGTPLGSIFVWLEVLKHDRLSDEERTRALAGIRGSAAMLWEYFEELTGLSRMIAGMVRLQSRPILLAVVIDSAVEAASPSALAKCVKVSKILDPQLGPVAGDADHLELLVRALLSNAVAFTPREGKVNVSLTRSDTCAQITVSDDGPGIDGDLDRIREGFPPTTKRGRDVRLYLAHLLALLHGGSITDLTEGEGNSFTVRMPLMD